MKKVTSHSEPLRWEKIGKVANRVKLAIRVILPYNGHLQFVALCAVTFTDSGWLSTAAASGQLC